MQAQFAKARRYDGKSFPTQHKTAHATSLCAALLLAGLLAACAAADSTVSALAGSGAYGFADGPGATAKFDTPSGVAVKSNGVVVVADAYNHRIRLVATDGTVSTLAGSGTSGFANGPGATAQLYYPYYVAVKSNDDVVVADAYNNRIRLVATDGTVSTLAGSGTAGSTDGIGTAVSFRSPQGVAVKSNGVVVVADTANHRIRLVATYVTTLAGSGASGFADGVGATAQFSSPRGVAVMANDIVVVADVNNYRIRLVATDGTVTTLAGSGTSGFADGPGVTAQFSSPCGVAVMANGNIVVADKGSNRIRLVFPNGYVTTLAGSGTAGSADGPGATAQFFNPEAVAVTSDGKVVVAHAPGWIRLIDASSLLCTTAMNCTSYAVSVSGSVAASCTCTCSTGYGGATCSSCATYYTGYPTCTPTPCTNATDCSGHASSVSGTLVSGCTCTCSTGYGGATCSSCATYYAGYPTCTPTPCTTATDCSGHASSVSGSLVSGCTCTCSTGYGGATCSACATFYAGYPTCALSCGSNVTLTSQPPAVKVLSVSLSPDSSSVSLLLGSKAQNSVVVAYQRDVAQLAPPRQLSAISKSDFNSYASCATMPGGTDVAADGTGNVEYSHAVNYSLCQQNVVGSYLVISCAFEIEHYVWLATDSVPLMTPSEAPVVVRVPRALEQAIEAERFTYEIFPGLLVVTARRTTRILNFTVVQSSSWLASSRMCAVSVDALSFSCVLQPAAAAGQHSADVRVVLVSGEVTFANVSTYYVGKHTPNIFGRKIALHFAAADLRYSPTRPLVFLYEPYDNASVNGNTTQFSALLFVNAAGETVPVLEHSAPFNLTCSNVPATNLTECLLFPAAVRTVNRRFDDSNPNLTLRATFSFEVLSNLRDSEDVVVASGLTIVDDEGEGTASSSRTAVIVAVCVVGGVGLLLLIGAAVYVVMRRGAAAKDAVSQLSPAVQIPNSNGETCSPA